MGKGEMSSFPRLHHHHSTTSSTSSSSSWRFFLSQIIYPQDIVTLRDPAWLLGWNLDQFKCMILGYVPQHLISVNRLEELLHHLHKSAAIFQICHCLQSLTAPIVLGEWHPILMDDYLPVSDYQSKGIWISLTNQHNIARLHSLFSLGNRYDTAVYMMAYPLLSYKHLQAIASAKPTGQGRSSNSNSNSNTMRYSDQERIVDLMNVVDEVNRLVHLAISLSSESPLSTSMQSREVIAKTCKQGLLIFGGLWYRILSLARTLCGQARPLMTFLTEAFTWRPLQLSTRAMAPQSSPVRPSISLETLSYTGYQISQKKRLCESCMRGLALLHLCWPIDPKYRVRHWFSLCSRLFYLLFDLVMGGLCAYWLYCYREDVVLAMRTSADNVAIYLTQFIDWFQRDPGGVKLNPFIVKKVGKLLLYAMRTWRQHVVQDLLLQYSLPLLHVLCSLGGLGWSVQMGLVLDCLFCLTWPVRIFHLLAAKEFLFHVQLLYSLFLFFKATKKNVLRNRYDSLEYDLDRLPFGIMLFSITLFLFPSFAVYYVFLTSLHVASITVSYLIFFFIESFKYVPFYGLLVSLLPLRKYGGAGLLGVTLTCLKDEKSLCTVESKIGHTRAAALRMYPIKPNSNQAPAKSTLTIENYDDVQVVMQEMSPRNRKTNKHHHFSLGSSSPITASSLLPSSQQSALSPLDDELASLLPLNEEVVCFKASNSSPLSPSNEVESDDAVTSPRVESKAEDALSNGLLGPPSIINPDNLLLEDSFLSSFKPSGDKSHSPGTHHHETELTRYYHHREGVSRLKSSGRSPKTAVLPRSLDCQTTYMVYQLSRPALADIFATLIKWFQFLLMQKGLIWKLLQRAISIQSLRDRSIAVALQYQTHQQTEEEQEVMDAINHIIRAKCQSGEVVDKEQALDELKALVSPNFPFHKLIQAIWDDSLSKETPLSATLAGDQRTKRFRTSCLAVVLLLVMTCSFLCALGVALYYLQGFTKPLSQEASIAWSSNLLGSSTQNISSSINQSSVSMEVIAEHTVHSISPAVSLP
eukprot:gene9516-10519_t